MLNYVYQYFLIIYSKFAFSNMQQGHKMNSIRTITINELLPGADRKIKYNFFIPKYQRGYRWKETQIKQLISDLFEFGSQKVDNTFYCLQPLVVKKDGSKWIVIDGQQRLTSIFIILSALYQIIYKEKPDLYTLDYENHSDLWQCLRNLGSENPKEEPSVNYDDINKYHITEAYRTVWNWFCKDNNYSQNDIKTKGNALNDIITNYTRFIWYEIDSQSKPETIFTDINMGKIKLTNAELVKAALLQKDNYKNDENSLEASRAKIGTAWDLIETTLSNTYFWKFLINSGDEEYPVKTELIFDIWARELLKGTDEEKKEEENNKDIYTFIVLDRFIKNTIEKNKTESKKRYSVLLEHDIWNYAESIFNMLCDWYNEREWYHLIGFLLASDENAVNNKITIEKILKIRKLYIDNTKDDFVKALKEEIRDSIFDNRYSNDISLKENIENLLADLQYGKDKKKIKQILLLLNIISTQEGNERSRFSFCSYKDQKWDIEHINAQTDDIPQEQKYREEWIETLKNYLDYILLSADEKKDKELKQKVIDLKKEDIDFNEKSRNLILDIVNALNDDIQNSSNEEAKTDIANLALLDSATNRSYKNYVFPIKREIILEKNSNDCFVPVCTRNVFLKFYNRNAKQMYKWDSQDRYSYFNAIVDKLSKYLEQ